MQTIMCFCFLLGQNSKAVWHSILAIFVVETIWSARIPDYGPSCRRTYSLLISSRFGSSSKVPKRFKRVGSKLPNDPAGRKLGCAWDLQVHIVSVLHKRPDFIYNVGHVLSWARQCAAALAFIHDKGLVHRDLKPGKSVSVFLKISFSVLFSALV